MSDEKPLIRGITLSELLMTLGGLVVMVCLVFLMWSHFTEDYVRKQEKWRNDATAIINHNIQQGRLVTMGTPQMQPAPQQKGVPTK